MGEFGMDSSATAQILIVEDDRPSQLYLQNLLTRWGYPNRVADTAEMALELLYQTPFHIVITDWILPGKSGVDFIEQIRKDRHLDYIYTILLTARSSTNDYHAAMEKGADDFLIKPVAENELRIRLRVAERIMNYQQELKNYAQRLSQAVQDIQTLGGFIHMCSYCNSIYTPQEKWLDVSRYLQEHANITVSHGICPACIPKVYPAHQDE